MRQNIYYNPFQLFDDGKRENKKLMKPLTSIRKVFFGNRLYVPDYHRAYSWEQKQLKQFIDDLSSQVEGNSSSPYYFGHFLFEGIEDQCEFMIIDGQQRLTTIVIFLSVAFRKLESMGCWSDDLAEIKEDIVKRNKTYRFNTVGYDNLIFRDYVIDGIPVNKDQLETSSARRIFNACDYFEKEISTWDKSRILSFIETIEKANATTYVVSNKAESVQIFIFQNNRGKQPTDLEVTKARFMYKVLVSDLPEDEKNFVLDEIEERFAAIYRSISSIEGRIQEDNVLRYATIAHKNNLGVENATEEIEKD